MLLCPRAKHAQRLSEDIRRAVTYPPKGFSSIFTQCLTTTSIRSRRFNRGIRNYSSSRQDRGKQLQGEYPASQNLAGAASEGIGERSITHHGDPTRQFGGPKSRTTHRTSKRDPERAERQEKRHRTHNVRLKVAEDILWSVFPKGQKQVNESLAWSERRKIMLADVRDITFARSDAPRQTPRQLLLLWCLLAVAADARLPGLMRQTLHHMTRNGRKMLDMHTVKRGSALMNLYILTLACIQKWVASLDLQDASNEVVRAELLIMLTGWPNGFPADDQSKWSPCLQDAGIHPAHPATRLNWLGSVRALGGSNAIMHLHDTYVRDYSDDQKANRARSFELELAEHGGRAHDIVIGQLHKCSGEAPEHLNDLTWKVAAPYLDRPDELAQGSWDCLLEDPDRVQDHGGWKPSMSQPVFTALQRMLSKIEKQFKVRWDSESQQHVPSKNGIWGGGLGDQWEEASTDLEDVQAVLRGDHFLLTEQDSLADDHSCAGIRAEEDKSMTKAKR